MRGSRVADVRLFAGEHRELRGADTRAAFQQRIVRAAIVPVELIDGPRRDGGLRKGADLLRVRAGDSLCERVARRCELGERASVERVDLRVEFAQGCDI
jgi:hypothetical protein